MGKGGYRKGRKRPNDSGPGGYASRQKHANGEGDYPPEHVLENPAFETYYRESGIVPEAEWDDFMKTLRRPLGVSFRITGAPSDPGAVALGEFMRARHMSQLTGSAAWSKWRLGSALARHQCILSALARLLSLCRPRLAAQGGSALPGRDRPTGRPATASGARASRLQSRRFHSL